MVVYEEARMEAIANTGEPDGDEPWDEDRPEPGRLPSEQVELGVGEFVRWGRRGC